MKMKKMISLLFILFILTGCGATFDVTIKDNTIKQNITITSNDNLINNSLYDTIKSNLLDNEHASEVLSYYDIISNNNPLKAKLENDLDNYTYDISLARCYNDQTITTKDNILSITTSSKFTCFSSYKILNDVTINLTSDYEVLENNADSVKNNTYTWYITKDNYLNKPINLKVNLNNNVVAKRNTYSFNIIVLSFVLFILSLISYLFINAKKNNNV